MKLNDVPERYRKRITVDDNGCWLWNGAKFKSGGYGAIRIAGKTLRLHVFIFEILVGPVPEGMQLHHRCEVKRCCNPDHLKIRTQLAHSAEHLATHCKQGHELTPENTIIHRPRSGQRHRQCRECRKEAARRWRERNREKIRSLDRGYYRKRKELHHGF